jgi:hypothetical protein
VSCPTEAFFAAVPPEPLLHPKFRRALAVDSLRYGHDFTGAGLLAGFSKTATKVSEISRVADFGDEPRFGGQAWSLFRNRLADRHRAKDDRMTRLRNRDVVLASVLREEQSLFSFQQGCQVEPAHGDINFEFHSLLLCCYRFTASLGRKGSHGIPPTQLNC